MAVYEEKWYTNSTSVGPYTFTFPYIKEADVKVEKNGTLLTLTTEYTQAFTSITLVSAPLSTDIIRIYRDTDSDTLSSTFYPGSAIRSSDLNDNFTQNLYSSQESAEKAKDALRATDAFIATTSDEGDTWVTAGNGTTHGQNPNPDPRGIGYAVTTSEAADTKSDTAVATANTADTNASAAVSTANTASTNASAAVTTANTASTTANTASTNASAAVTTANAADTKADTAITTANSATTTANAASTTATTADTNASAAVTTANTASTNASAAVTTAGAAEAAIEKYVADANGLKGAGTTHGETPDTDPRGVAYAVATAESAANSVAQSAIYTVVANFAALPDFTDPTDLAALSAEGASPYYQVTDSTLIQNESTVTGEPANFIGDDELAVKLKANITASPKVWEWQEYYATDPETRYRKKLIVENLATISEDYTIGIGNNGLSVGTVTISSANTVTIPANSRYVVL